MSQAILEEELRKIHDDAPRAQNGRIGQNIALQVGEESVVIPEGSKVHFLPRTCRGAKVRDWNRATIFLGSETNGASLQVAPADEDSFTVVYRSGRRMRPAGYAARHGRYTGAGANVEPMTSVN